MTRSVNVWEWCADLYVKEIEHLPDGGAPYDPPSGNTNRKRVSVVRVHRGTSEANLLRKLETKIVEPAEACARQLRRLKHPTTVDDQ
jgi:formylglycine-generating enzyme required for sulfatase activity